VSSGVSVVFEVLLLLPLEGDDDDVLDVDDEAVLVALGFNPSARALFKASTSSFFSKKVRVEIP
jgi:hypothetical protein